MNEYRIEYFDRELESNQATYISCEGGVKEAIEIFRNDLNFNSVDYRIVEVSKLYKIQNWMNVPKLR